MNLSQNNIIDRLINILTKIIEFLVTISVGALALILVISVLFRYVLSNPIIGADEITLLLLAWVTYLGVCLSIKDRNMVAVTFLIEKFPTKIKSLTEIFIQFSIILFSALFLYIGTEWLTSTTIMNANSPALRIPLWIPYSVFPISMLFMLIFACNNIRLLLKEGKGGKN